MQGKRINAQDNPRFAPGDYGRVSDGTWYAMTPNGHLGNLASHDVTEHEDGTISVSPSILLTSAQGDVDLWHGYLEHGIWREV